MFILATNERNEPCTFRSYCGQLCQAYPILRNRLSRTREGVHLTSSAPTIERLIMRCLVQTQTGSGIT